MYLEGGGLGVPVHLRGVVFVHRSSSSLALQEVHRRPDQGLIGRAARRRRARVQPSSSIVAYTMWYLRTRRCKESSHRDLQRESGPGAPPPVVSKPQSVQGHQIQPSLDLFGGRVVGDARTAAMASPIGMNLSSLIGPMRGNNETPAPGTRSTAQRLHLHVAHGRFSHLK